MTFRPRIRTIKPEMWADEKVGQLSRDARLLFVGLITMADDEGRLRGMPAGVLGHVFPYDVDALRKLETWLTELTACGLVVGYEHDGVRYFYVPGFVEHQVINKAKPSALPVPPRSAEGTAPEPAPVAVPDESRTDTAPGTDVVVPSRARGGSGTERNGEKADAFSSAVADAERPEVAHLCRLLASLIVANDPGAKPKPDSKGWRDAGRLLLDTDHRTIPEVEAVIRFSQADGFWKANVLSMPKLREKFGQLLLKSQAQPQPSRFAGPTEEDFLRIARGEAA